MNSRPPEPIWLNTNKETPIPISTVSPPSVKDDSELGSEGLEVMAFDDSENAMEMQI